MLKAIANPADIQYEIFKNPSSAAAIRAQHSYYT
jgi:hypothetical protein